METIDQVLQLLGTVALYGGGSAALAYGIFKHLGKGWIDARFSERLEAFKHEQAKEIQRMKIEVESVLSGSLKLQEREFSILPEAWKKMDDAYGLTQWLTSPMQQHPALNRLSDIELEEFLATSDLQESQKSSVRGASVGYDREHSREGVYQDVFFWHRLHRVKRAVADYQTYIASNGLFLPPSLKMQFNEITPHLWAAVSTMETAHEAKLWEMKSEAWKKLEENAKPLHLAIEAGIEERLHSHAKGKP